ncbi:MAG: Gfo/Idh/MocA family oxidoreductase [Candidatus Latescibacteria bacterium]|nr:Gfo/Idh/MocA family oxidoreductase [Candidatus Latescibacterota bacterium]
MGDVLSVGMVGSGGIARAHMRAIEASDNIRTVAVMDIDAGQAESAASEYGARAYTSLDALLDDSEVQGVHVCTPHNQHLEPVVKAAEAGKHVLVEKPMALTLEECDGMMAECEEAGVVLMVGQVVRHFPVSRKIKQLIAEGAVGEVGHMVRRRYGNFNPTPAPGQDKHWYLDLEAGGICVLYCFGPHEYDILHWFIDSPVVKVYSQGNESTDRYAGQKDSYTTIMNHANGAVSVVSQTVVCHSGAHDQHVIGSEGSMMATGSNLLLNGEAVELDGENRDGMVRQVQEFATCCMEDTEPDASAMSVRHTMAIIEAAKQSAERGEVVMVSEFE